MKKLIITSLAFGAFSFAGGSATAADVYLCAGATTKTMADNVVVPMWGFAQVGTPAELVPGCSANATVPGPELKNVDDGAGLTVYLFNDGIAEPISIIIPGQTDTTMVPQFFQSGDAHFLEYGGRLRSFTHETFDGSAAADPATAVVQYTWNSLKPGTYAYQSGSHQAVQVQMGLYGALIKDVVPGVPAAPPAAAIPGQAYPVNTTSAQTYEYDNDAVLLYSEVDSVLHFAIAGIDPDTGAPTIGPTYGPGTATTSTVNYAPDYFLLNGEDIPSAPLPVGTSGQTTLIRMINMGSKIHQPTFQGIYVHLIAEDGNPYSYVKQQYSVMLAAGKTKDALFGPTIAGEIAFYDRRLFLTNRIPSAAAGGIVLAEAPGTNITFLSVAPNAVVDTDGDTVADNIDNCLEVPNTNQLNGDADVFGNACDADFDGNGTVDFPDYFTFIGSFGAVNPLADFDGSGTVDFPDYFTFLSFYGSAPGPAGADAPVGPTN